MNKNRKSPQGGIYDEHDSGLSQQSEEFIKMLKVRGMVEDTAITDDRKRHADKEKKRQMYHNTLLLLKHYRDISWMLECFPAHIAEELDRPMHDLDALLSIISSEVDMDNLKLENRLKSVQRSRLLLDRLNEALTVLMRKPGNGKALYDVVYQTFIIPDSLPLNDVIYRLDLSPRHYYRLRQQAINILSLRLWVAPAAELDSWLEVLTLLETL